LLSILAGFLIAMGGIINLTLGGIPGALFFSLGLLTIVTFKYELFTGKAGLLTTGEIKSWKLFTIWLGNFIGTAACALMVSMTPSAETLTTKAAAIVALRSGQPAIVNLLLGIYCGMLMYIAVTGFKYSQNYLFIIMPVAFFILCGFNHCVADMFYTSLGATEWKHYLHLIPTTIGNIIGFNLIPLADYYHRGV
jgi:formate/nitrite transporter FocA (FNT family)